MKQLVVFVYPLAIIVPVLPEPPFRKFQNLRTIIVIADVHWRFGDWREPLPLTFQHWSGVTPYTSPCGLAESCVFGKQSLGKLSLRPALRPGRHLANLRLAFLPSSLTKTLPFALGYSPSPPVSVFGTDTVRSASLAHAPNF